MNPIITQPFTNVQLDLLKLLNSGLESKDYLELKKILSMYLAQKAISNADKVWNEKSWNSDSENQFLNEHNRSKYNS
jgi:hypothetical protein